MLSARLVNTVIQTFNDVPHNTVFYLARFSGGGFWKSPKINKGLLLYRHTPQCVLFALTIIVLFHALISAFYRV